jgi:hypothetical protein
LPNVIWQYQRGFPTWVDLSNVKRTHKNVELPPLQFLLQQIMMLLPVSVIVWIAGLGFLLFNAQGKRYRVLGVTYLVFLAIMMTLHAKDYYLAPIYPMLFAAGGVFWESFLAAHAKWRWMKLALPALVLVLGVLAVPFVIPVLPPERVGPYMEAFGLKLPKTETHMSARSRNTSAMNSGGRKWLLPSPSSITHCRRKSRPRPASWQGTTGKLVPLIFLVQSMDCPGPSALTRITFIGDRGNTRGKV